MCHSESDRERPWGRKNAPCWVLNLLQKYPWLPICRPRHGDRLGGASRRTCSCGRQFYWHCGSQLAGFISSRSLMRWQTVNAAAQSITEQNQTSAAVDQLPKSPTLSLPIPAAIFRPAPDHGPPTATNFKNALRDSFSLLVATRTVSRRLAPVALSLASLTTSMVQSCRSSGDNP